MTLFEKAIAQLVEKHSTHINGPDFLIEQVQVIEQLTQRASSPLGLDADVVLLIRLANHARYRLLNSHWNDGGQYQDAPLFYGWSMYDIESRLSMGIALGQDVSESYQSYLYFSQNET